MGQHLLDAFSKLFPEREIAYRKEFLSIYE